MLTYLLELRRRCIQILLFFSAVFVLFFFLANDLFQFLVSPLLHVLVSNQSLVATQIASPLFTPLKLAADASLLATMPLILFHFWRFLSPALYHHERITLRTVLGLSLLLFLIGLLFCFYLILPFMFHFFIQALPKGVQYLPDITCTLDFITHMLLVFGLCFQVPLICFLLVRLKLLDLIQLKKIRPYVIVGAFILGMLLTPPDVGSQILLAVPLCLLFELGIGLIMLFC